MDRGATPGARAAAATHLRLHAWGLWTAITAPATQSSGGRQLRVFETWRSIDELLQPATSTEDFLGDNRRILRGPVALRRERVVRPLRPIDLGERDETLPAHRPVHPETSANANPVLGFVKFNPEAADHVARQDLLHTATFATLIGAGAVSIPPFPASALVAKPVYQLIRRSEIVDGRYYRLPAWSGPPANAQAWSPELWPDGVWVDLLGGGEGRGVLDHNPARDGSTRTAATTYPLQDFLYHRLSAAEAAALNDADAHNDASPGDVALLVAMHVASREIARWTWQTFWWAAEPDTPPDPSSTASAGARPPQLQGAARHYALALAYTMLSPDEPYTGGANAAPAVYAYNPYIEARFGPADLPDSQPGFAPDGAPSTNNTGVQTNCMSCHARATFRPAGLTTAPRFTGARYVDLIDPQFVGTLQTDFLWSLPRHAR